MHSILFESSDQEPFVVCLVKSVAPLLWFVMTDLQRVKTSTHQTWSGLPHSTSPDCIYIGIQIPFE